MTFIVVSDDLLVSLSTQFTIVLSRAVFTGLIDNTDARDKLLMFWIEVLAKVNTIPLTLKFEVALVVETSLE